jgi:hypothetical protein
MDETTTTPKLVDTDMLAHVASYAHQPNRSKGHHASVTLYRIVAVKPGEQTRLHGPFRSLRDVSRHANNARAAGFTVAVQRARWETIEQT